MNMLPKEVLLSPSPPKKGDLESDEASSTNYQFIGNTGQKMGCYQQKTTGDCRQTTLVLQQNFCKKEVGRM